jgi:type IV pilus assembly protein PilY1
MTCLNRFTSSKTILGAVLGLMMGFSSLSHADVAISDVPLFLTTQVSPNILLALDDSGSMDGELLLPGNDGAAWWNDTNESFTGSGANADVTSDVAASTSTLNFNVDGAANSTWKKFVYLFPNGQNGSYDGRRRYDDSTNDHFAIPPITRLAWARSSEFNNAYFDPSVVYSPWPSTNTKTYTNSNPVAASPDPQSSAAAFNLTANVESNLENWRFRFFSGMVIETGARVNNGTNWVDVITPITVSPTTSVKANQSHGVRYFPATFYSRSSSAIAGYVANLTPVGFSPGAVTANLYRYEIKPVNFSSSDAYAAAMQNFANWFTYYRKRHLATRGGVVESFEDAANARVGWFRINNGTPSVTMRSLASGAEKSTLFNSVYDYVMNQGLGGTPNRRAINEAGKLFRNDTNIIQYACQSNTTVLFTDGYSNADFPDNTNYDAAKGAPYADTASGTIADLAMKYYDSSFVPLRTGTAFPPGRVPVPTECSLTNRDPSLDCNRDLHMNTYAVTLGTKGILFDPDSLSPVDPYQNPPSWWSSFTNRNPKAVDDLWHATINGRGALLNANTPAQVSSEMKKILNTILARVGSASSVAANSTRLDTDTRIFQAKFDSTDWSGEVLAYSVGAAGDIKDQIWSTDDTLKHDSPRTLLSWNGTTGINFTTTLSNYSAAQLTALGTNTAERAARIAWVRGAQSQELRNGGSYRNRVKVLGDVINSDPTFVGKDNFRYDLLPEGLDGSYETYVEGKDSRPPLLLFGANDGMLHGLNAVNGTELFGYVPGSIYPKLTKLTDPLYSHNFLVDATPRVGDAFLNGAWKTIAVGGTGLGGRSVFALDVTNPNSVDMTSSKVLWEISGQLQQGNVTHGIGEGISQPTVIRLADGNWGAVFGNGYNSGGNVKLVIVRLDTGAVIRVIDTGVTSLDQNNGLGPNGLGPVAPVDIQGDRITDFVYAGDLQGNLWKFDLTSTNSGQWAVAFKQGNVSKPLITVADGTKRQPITSRPVVGRHPDGGYMVYFGTGSYFKEGDNVVGPTPPLQRFYGVRDNGSVVATTSLQRQTIVYQDNVPGFGQARVYSDTLVNYPTKAGWYLDLKYPANGSANGERVVSTPLLRFGRIIFTSIIPSQDPCDFGGTSWINELDAISGARLTYSVFDVNGDGLIDDGDFVQLADGTKVSVGGKGFNEIIKTPGIVGAGEREYKYTSGSSGTLGVTAEAGDPAPVGRQSWRQLQ